MSCHVTFWCRRAMGRRARASRRFLGSGQRFAASRHVRIRKRPRLGWPTLVRTGGRVQGAVARRGGRLGCGRCGCLGRCCSRCCSRMRRVHGGLLLLPDGEDCVDHKKSLVEKRDLIPRRTLPGLREPLSPRTARNATHGHVRSLAAPSGEGVPGPEIRYHVKTWSACTTHTT